jgi:hypothetical protein
MHNPFASPKFRAACYALGGAILLILGIYDLVTPEQSAAWSQFLGAALAVLALLNVPEIRAGKPGDES